MSKNIVICCDGTGNEVKANLSNVLKLFRIVQKNEEQRVYYGPGIGTLGNDDPWSRVKQNTKAVFGLATGYGLDAEILAAYRFICEHFKPDDAIFLFGFSRGAYSVRALAGLINMVGLLPPDQQNVANYALTAYKQSSEKDDLAIAWNFQRVIGARRATIKFVGVWDTVASVIVPRRDRIFPTLLMLPYTRKNPCVEVFRHAMAIDEWRRMFRLNRWDAVQKFVANPFDKTKHEKAQDTRQVWFAGCHSDVGGGYPEVDSGLSKFPLTWMIDEAVQHGLKIHPLMKKQLALGQPRVGGTKTYVPPSATATLHDSLTWGWKPLEWIPKATKWNEWPRAHILGHYIPDAEPRLVDDPDHKPILHQSVIDRKSKDPSYSPSTTPLISTSRSGPIPSKLPAHQSLINRRLDASASCYAQPILLNRIHAAAERTGTAIVLDHGHENHGEEVFGRALREVPFQQAAGEGLYFLPQQPLRRQ
jgi:uncharacterized protein (DUF2235 family)